MSLFERIKNKRYELQEKKNGQIPDPWWDEYKKYGRRNQQAYDTFDDSDSGAPRDTEDLKDVYKRNRRNNASNTSTGNNTGNAYSRNRSKGSGSRTTSTNRTNYGGGNSNNSGGGNSGGGSGGGRGSNNAGSGQSGDGKQWNKYEKDAKKYRKLKNYQKFKKFTTRAVGKIVGKTRLGTVARLAAVVGAVKGYDMLTNRVKGQVPISNRNTKSLGPIVDKDGKELKYQYNLRGINSKGESIPKNVSTNDLNKGLKSGKYRYKSGQDYNKLLPKK